MKIFIDTLDLDAIKEYSDLGILSGVTTNPTFSKKFNMYNDIETIKKIREVLGNNDTEIHIEVLGDSIENIIYNAKKLYENTKDSGLVFKIPFSKIGLKASNKLRLLGYKTNIHLVYSVNQALLSTFSIPDYVTPLVGRLEDIGVNAFDILKNMKKAFDLKNETTEIMVASVRNPSHVEKAYILGIEFITIPPKVLDLMFQHPLTEKGIIQFKKDVKTIL